MLRYLNTTRKRARCVFRTRVCNRPFSKTGFLQSYGCRLPGYLNLNLLGPTERGGVGVEDDVRGLQGDVAEDVDADVSGGLDATVALAGDEGLL